MSIPGPRPRAPNQNLQGEAGEFACGANTLHLRPTEVQEQWGDPNTPTGRSRRGWAETGEVEEVSQEFLATLEQGGPGERGPFHGMLVLFVQQFCRNIWAVDERW